MKFLCFFLFPLFAIAQSADTLDKFDYVLPIPKGWTIKEGCQAQDCSLLAPQDHSKDTFLENLNITVAEAPAKNYPVEKYVDFSAQYLPSVIDGFKILERKKLEGNKAYLIYTGTKNDFLQTWKQVYWIKGEKLYILTLSTESSQFENYIQNIGSFLEAFTLKD